MNYFAALLASAGLLVTQGSVTAQPSVAVVPVSPPATVSTLTPTGAGPLTTVSASYGTLALAGPSTGSNTTAVGGGSSTGSASGGGTGTSGGSSPPLSSSGARQMIDLINQARVAAGLKPYTVNATLMQLAAERAKALAVDGVFTDDLPGLGWPVQQEQAAGINASGMGAENIAEASTVAQAFELLMASPPHKSNILNPYETQIGVGVYPLPNGVAISELFIGPNL
jgi:uncharacterized protein YkwD